MMPLMKVLRLDYQPSEGKQSKKVEFSEVAQRLVILPAVSQQRQKPISVTRLHMHDRLHRRQQTKSRGVPWEAELAIKDDKTKGSKESGGQIKESSSDLEIVEREMMKGANRIVKLEGHDSLSDGRIQGILSALRLDYWYISQNWSDVKLVLRLEFQEVYYLNGFNRLLELHCFMAVHSEKFCGMPFSPENEGTSPRLEHPNGLQLELLPLSLCLYFNTLSRFLGNNMLSYSALVEQFTLLANKAISMRLSRSIAISFGVLLEETAEFSYLISGQNRAALATVYFSHLNALLSHNLRFLRGRGGSYYCLRCEGIDIVAVMQLLTKDQGLLRFAVGEKAGFGRQLSEYFEVAQQLSLHEALSDSFPCEMFGDRMELFSSLFMFLGSSRLSGLVPVYADIKEKRDTFATLYLLYLALLQRLRSQPTKQQRIAGCWDSVQLAFRSVQCHLQIGGELLAFDEYLMQQTWLLLSWLLKLAVATQASGYERLIGLVSTVALCVVQAVENSGDRPTTVAKYGFLLVHVREFEAVVKKSRLHLVARAKTITLLETFGAIKRRLTTEL